MECWNWKGFGGDGLVAKSCTTLTTPWTVAHHAEGTDLEWNKEGIHNKMYPSMGHYRSDSLESLHVIRLVCAGCQSMLQVRSYPWGRTVSCTSCQFKRDEEDGWRENRVVMTIRNCLQLGCVMGWAVTPQFTH